MCWVMSLFVTGSQLEKYWSAPKDSMEFLDMDHQKHVSAIDDEDALVIQTRNHVARNVLLWMHEAIGCLTLDHQRLTIAEARSSLFDGDDAQAKHGKRLFHEQVQQLQQLRGYVEQCRQKTESRMSAQKLERVWRSRRIGNLAHRV